VLILLFKWAIHYVRRPSERAARRAAWRAWLNDEDDARTFPR
jgi:hypothetical protein